MKTSLILLGLALVCGAVLRLYHLDQNSQGIHPDEALYAYEGWSIQTTGCDYRLTGCPPLYLKGYSTTWDNRTSVLYPYMFSVLWRFVPMTTMAIRLPSVIIGLGVIVLTFLLALRIFPLRPLIAGIATILVALSPIAVSWSRIGHDPITVPFLVLLIAYSISRAADRPGWWLVAGLALAVGMYGYQPFKFVGVSVVIISLWYTKLRWTPEQRRWIISSLVISGLLVMPFLVNQIYNWNTVQQQFNKLSLLGDNTGRLWVLWNVDQYIFSLLTNVAVYLPFVTLFAGMGLVFIWKRWHRLAVYFSLWLVLGLVPVFITLWRIGSNEMQSRGLGIVGPLEILAAAGLVFLYDRWKKYTWRPERMAALVIIGALLLGQVAVAGYMNRVRGGFCCFMLGGMEQVAAIVQQPVYRDRPVVIQHLFFMQGVNLLWNMKIPPRAAQASGLKWESWEDTEVLTPIDRFRLCYIDDCYQPNDGALYVVPVDLLPDIPTIFTFQLSLYGKVQQWKIVDNALRPN